MLWDTGLYGKTFLEIQKPWFCSGKTVGSTADIPFLSGKKDMNAFPSVSISPFFQFISL